jgi:hypothetical protein
VTLTPVEWNAATKAIQLQFDTAGVEKPAPTPNIPKLSTTQLQIVWPKAEPETKQVLMFTLPLAAVMPMQSLLQPSAGGNAIKTWSAVIDPKDAKNVNLTLRDIEAGEYTLTLRVTYGKGEDAVGEVKITIVRP